MGRFKESIARREIDSILPYISSGTFRQADQNCVVEGSNFIPPKKGAGKYSLPNALERSRFHERSSFYDPRQSEDTRRRKKDRENHNRQLYKQQAR